MYAFLARRYDSTSVELIPNNRLDKSTGDLVVSSSEYTERLKSKTRNTYFLPQHLQPHPGPTLTDQIRFHVISVKSNYLRIAHFKFSSVAPFFPIKTLAADA